MTYFGGDIAVLHTEIKNQLMFGNVWNLAVSHFIVFQDVHINHKQDEFRPLSFSATGVDYSQLGSGNLQTIFLYKLIVFAYSCYII